MDHAALDQRPTRAEGAVRAALILLLTAGCAVHQPEPAPPLPPEPCSIPLVTIGPQDLVTPATLAGVRRTNAEIRSQCRSNP